MLLLLAGSSGAGTTTLAAATALHAVQRGLRTLLVAVNGTDGALALNDILVPGTSSGIEIRTAPAPDEPLPQVPAEALWVRPCTVRATDAVARRWFGSDPGWPAAALSQAGLHHVASDVMGDIALMDDVAALHELTLWSERDDLDLVVVDAGSDRRLAQLIERAEQIPRLANGLLDVGTRVARATHLIEDPLTGPVDALVEISRRAARRLRHGDTWVRLVASCEPPTLVRTERALARLALYDLWVEALVLRSPELAAALPTRAAGIDADLRTIFWPRAEPAYVGAEQLSLIPSASPDAVSATPHGSRPAGQRVQVSDPPTRFDLLIRLTGAVRSDRVRLARHGDDMVVDLDGHRRVLPLASALRRCVVHGATLEQGCLRVGFEPDPNLWPTR